jgi:hypothetical protein
MPAGEQARVSVFQGLVYRPGHGHEVCTAQMGMHRQRDDGVGESLAYRKISRLVSQRSARGLKVNRDRIVNTALDLAAQQFLSDKVARLLSLNRVKGALRGAVTRSFATILLSLCVPIASSRRSPMRIAG